MKGKTSKIALAGAVKQSLESLFTKAATKYCGKWELVMKMLAK